MRDSIGLLIYSRPIAAGDIRLRATELAVRLRGKCPQTVKSNTRSPRANKRLERPQRETLNPLGAFTLDPSGKSIS